MFQSPRSGKFVSDTAILATLAFAAFAFQSPRSGKFVSDAKGPDKVGVLILFQSPRSGKFVSDFSGALVLSKRSFSHRVSIP